MELGNAIDFLRSLRCRVEVIEINVRRLDIKACIFFVMIDLLLIVHVGRDLSSKMVINQCIII